jgi:hypothetical protein
LSRVTIVTIYTQHARATHDKVGLMQRLYLVGAAVLALVAPDAPVGVADLVARHIQACGGGEKLRGLMSVREVGTIAVYDAGASVSTGASLTEEKRPNKSRAERTIHGVKMVWAFDGSTAWSQRGGAEPARLSGEAAKGLAANEFEHFLLDHDRRGIRIALEGTVSLESGPAYKLKVTLPTGTVRYCYLDKVSFLEVRRDYVEGDGTVSQQWFRGHRAFDGVTRPTVFEMQYPNGRRVVVTLDRVDLNPPIDDDRFRIRPSR